MNLLFLSDLHLDVNEEILGRNIEHDVALFIKEKNPDKVIISGDISGDAKESIKIIESLEKITEIPIGFVPGNHDIWTEKKSDDASWKSYDLLKKHHSSLINNPILFNDYVVIGAMSWYDYSFGPDNVFDKTLFERKKAKFWNDARFAKWNMTDKDLCQKMLNETKEKLENFKDKKIILVNHYIPYEVFTTKKASDDNWNFCNAYMGTSKLGEIIDEYQNIQYVSFGHTHKRFGEVEYKNKKIICSPLGYVGEWESENIKEELEKSSILLTL